MDVERRPVVVITGASAGVGRAAVREFARSGWWIGLIARGRDGLEAARAEVEAAGGRALAIEADVVDPVAIESAADQVENELGQIDVWVNNAMTSVFAPVRDLAADEVRRVTEVNYLGFVHGTLTALRRMLPRDRGVIVQVGSALAYRSVPLQAAYCGSKHAIVGFTDSLRSELIHDGSHVRVTMVQLPAMNTPQFSWVRSKLPRRAQPVPPIFQPEVGARAIVWAATRPQREVQVGGPTLLAIAAQKVAPGIADWYLARTGYDSQQSPAPEQPGRPDNLREPLSGDWGAHGRFDAESSGTSAQFWLRTHPVIFGAVAAGIGGLLIAGLFRR